MKNLFFIFLIIFLSQCRPKGDNTITQFHGKPEVPSSIKETHAYLLAQLHKMLLYKDSSGRVAKKLEELMQHHFKEEEDFILPPLGLLPLLAKGQMPEQSKDVMLLCEKVQTMMDHMSAEHQLIEAYIEELKQASDNENQPSIIEFENEVIQHAKSEEEVFFPTSILIGKYLELKVVNKP
ncbi:MAG: hemerythrin domain-containing protein [Ginsengibacter sp.]